MNTNDLIAATEIQLQHMGSEIQLAQKFKAGESYSLSETAELAGIVTSLLEAKTQIEAKIAQIERVLSSDAKIKVVDFKAELQEQTSKIVQIGELFKGVVQANEKEKAKVPLASATARAGQAAPSGPIVLRAREIFKGVVTQTCEGVSGKSVRERIAQFNTQALAGSTPPAPIVTRSLALAPKNCSAPAAPVVPKPESVPKIDPEKALVEALIANTANPKDLIALVLEVCQKGNNLQSLVSHLPKTGSVEDQIMERIKLVAGLELFLAEIKAGYQDDIAINRLVVEEAITTCSATIAQKIADSYVLQNVPGDGNCFFHAVKASAHLNMDHSDLRQVMGPSLLKILRDVSPENASLKNSLADELNGHYNVYQTGIPGDNATVASFYTFLSQAFPGKTVSEANKAFIAQCRVDLKQDPRWFDIYVAFMSKNGMYVAGPEIVALAKALNRPIIIYRDTGAGVFIDKINVKATEKPILIYHSGVHYQALIKKK